MAFYIETNKLKNADDLEAALNDLLEINIHSAEELGEWLIKRSTLFNEIEEMLTGHYIQFQQNNADEKVKQQFEYDQEVIMPIIKKYEARLDQFFYNSPYRTKLDQAYYAPYIKSKQTAMELFREENIALEIQEDKLSTRYFEITGALTVEWEGEEKTLSQMQPLLKDANRSVRERAWKGIFQQVQSKKDELETIMDELVEVRHKKAQNAELLNYRDYMFKKYERFSYTPADCMALAEAVRQHVVPLKEEIDSQHQQKLQLDDYRPWDIQAVATGEMPLQPFSTTEQLLNGSMMIFKQLDPAFVHLVETLHSDHLLDLESRKNKSQGGFCSELPLSKQSFIFMNASNTQDDMTTFLHEMGHCIHNDLKKEIKLSKYRDTPMESAELASMSMELFTMDYWDVFYKEDEELKRAKREQLEGIIRFLPWGIVVDQLQHWMYEHPQHTAQERNDYFEKLAREFVFPRVKWDGYEGELRSRWLMQLHIFEVPFYYIEYVIAQLGALQLYKKFKENKIQALADYRAALALGSSKSLQDVYETAGIQFDFSAEMIAELMTFVKQELASL